MLKCTGASSPSDVDSRSRTIELSALQTASQGKRGSSIASDGTLHSGGGGNRNEASRGAGVNADADSDKAADERARK